MLRDLMKYITFAKEIKFKEHPSKVFLKGPCLFFNSLNGENAPSHRWPLRIRDWLVDDEIVPPDVLWHLPQVGEAEHHNVGLLDAAGIDGA